jgi:5-methylcytosine-specific restriction endonuclease McrA
MNASHPLVIEFLKTLRKYDVCGKCRRRINENRVVFWITKRKIERGGPYVSYGCVDCLNGKQQETRRRRVFGITEFNDPEYNSPFPYKEWGAMLDRCGYACAICGKVGKVAIDHIVPISKGGDHNIENLQPLCQSCNSRKSNKLL